MDEGKRKPTRKKEAEENEEEVLAQSVLPFHTVLRVFLVEKRHEEMLLTMVSSAGGASRGGAQGFDLEAQSRSTHKPTRVGEPEFGEGDAQASKGELHFPEVFSCAMTGVIKQPIACRSLLLPHQVHEKGIGQGEHAEQFETSFPVVDAQTLDGHFAFEVAERHAQSASDVRKPARLSRHLLPF